MLSKGPLGSRALDKPYHLSNYADDVMYPGDPLYLEGSLDNIVHAGWKMVEIGSWIISELSHVNHFYLDKVTHG